MAKYVPPHKRGAGGVVSDARTMGEAPNLSNNRSRNARRTRTATTGSDTDTLFCNAFTSIKCINLKRRPEQWERFLYRARRLGPSFVSKVERFEAIDGEEALDTGSPQIGTDVALTWDTTQNALWDRHVESCCCRKMTPGEIGCALSHIALWRELVSRQTHLGRKVLPEETMLILEDDAAFLHPYRQGRFNETARQSCAMSADRFKIAFRLTWELLPADWDVLYLGLSDRGDRIGVTTSAESDECSRISVQLFRPTYGFHTHAYAIKKSAAKVLLDNLPVVGPVDVWLADNSWFGMVVYCAVVANDGWRNTGANLISQNRVADSSVGMSSRDSKE